MKAAILVKNKSDLLVADIEMPNKLKFGQVLVKIKYSGICGAQINEIDAVKGKDNFLPHLLGHEGSGIVLEVGEGVKNVSKGDNVILHWKKNLGIECEVPKYKFKNKTINAGWVTTFNERAIVSENRLTKISKKVNLKTATLFGCSLTTGFGAVNNEANVKIGQSVLVIGVGGVGLNIVQASSLVSASPIIGIDINNFKLKLAKKFGMSHGLLNNKKLKDNILKILGNFNPDIVFETTGRSEMIEFAYEITSAKGKTILVGVPNKKIKLYTLPLHFEKILKGSEGGKIVPSVDIPNYLKIIKEKKIDLNKIITHEFKLDKINEAIKLFRKGLAGRIVIKM